MVNGTSGATTTAPTRTRSNGEADSAYIVTYIKKQNRDLRGVAFVLFSFVALVLKMFLLIELRGIGGGSVAFYRSRYATFRIRVLSSAPSGHLLSIKKA